MIRRPHRSTLTDTLFPYSTPLRSDYSGAYKGGIITPGINLSLDALVLAAAKLPRIAIEAPAGASVIGRTTEDQMHIGVFWGYVAMMEGLVAKLRAEIGRPTRTIATGGLRSEERRVGKECVRTVKSR